MASFTSTVNCADFQTITTTNISTHRTTHYATHFTIHNGTNRTSNFATNRKTQLATVCATQLNITLAINSTTDSPANNAAHCAIYTKANSTSNSSPAFSWLHQLPNTSTQSCHFVLDGSFIGFD